MENNKYYTPSLEEFHVGFEYEYETWTKGKWEKSEIEEYGEGGDTGHGYSISLEDKIEDNKIRVKYLDKEDIENLGFTQITDDCFNLPIKEYRGRLNQEVRVLVRETILIYLALDSNLGDKDNIVLFTGTIKNKSELKTLLKWLGIC